MNDKNKIQLLAKELMFELSDDDINSICNEFELIENQLKSIENMQIDVIHPTSYCIEFENNTLREDVITIEDKNPFSNCKCLSGKYVVIKNEK